MIDHQFHIISASCLVTLIESIEAFPNLEQTKMRQVMAGLAGHWIQWNTQSAQSKQDLGAHWAHRKRKRRRILYDITFPLSQPCMAYIDCACVRLKERSMLSWAIGFAGGHPIGTLKITQNPPSMAMENVPFTDDGLDEAQLQLLLTYNDTFTAAIWLWLTVRHGKIHHF